MSSQAAVEISPEVIVKEAEKELAKGRQSEVRVMELFHKTDFASYSEPPEHDPGEAITDAWVMKTLIGKALAVKEMLIAKGFAVRATQDIGDESAVFHLCAKKSQ